MKKMKYTYGLVSIVAIASMLSGCAQSIEGVTGARMAIIESKEQAEYNRIIARYNGFAGACRTMGGEAVSTITDGTACIKGGALIGRFNG
jgi:hypothetical protein